MCYVVDTNPGTPVIWLKVNQVGQKISKAGRSDEKSSSKLLRRDPFKYKNKISERKKLGKKHHAVSINEEWYSYIYTRWNWH